MKKRFIVIVLVSCWMLASCQTNPQISSTTPNISQNTNESDSRYESFTITWENYDGTILEVDNDVSYGSTPSYDGSIPTKPSDDFKYEFKGWSPEIESVKENTTYTATYDSFRLADSLELNA